MAGRASSPRLVGREEELARLRAAVADAAAGRSRFVLVAGEAGIGKSRLAAELVDAPGADVHALVGRCLAIGHGGLPYAPLAGALRRLGRDLDPATLTQVLGPARADLARLVPDLAAGGRPGSEASGGVVDRADRARLFELLLGFFARLGADRPVLFVVEDVHWADDATRDLLTYLVANLRAEHVALVATLRTDAVGLDPGFASWLVELGRASGSERLDLGPLSSGQVADQVRAILGSPPPPTLTAAVAARSGGNALFVEALVAAGAEAGPDGRDAAGAPRLPDTLRAMLAARIRDVPSATAAVIRVLAVAGRAVDDRLLAAVTGLPAAAVDEALRDAVARHLVDVDPHGQLVDVHHVLLREAILAELLGGERRELHAALAAVLTARPELADPSPAGAAGEVAQHWAAADRPAEAFRAALAAADAALGVRAFAEAARFRRRALDLLPRLPAGLRDEIPDEIELLLDAEEAANLAGDLAAAVELLERAQRVVDPAGDPVRAGVVESRLGYHRWLAGRSDEALVHHRRAVDLVPAHPPSLVRARVVRGLGGALMGLGRYRESAAVCEAAIDAARAAGAPIEEGRALNMLGMDRVGIGDVDGGIDALAAACALARTHDPGEGLIVGLQNLAYHLGLADRPEDALAAATEGIVAARREGLDRRYGLTLRAAAADVLLRLGRWGEADDLVAEGRSLDPAGEGPLYLVIVRLRLATARGRFDDAQRALDVANAMAAADVDFDLVAYLRTAEAELACWTGRPDLAATAVAAGLAALEGSDDVFLAAPLLALGARAAADRAETARAWRDEAALADAGSAVAALEARIDTVAEGGPGGPGSTTRGLRATVAWGRAEAARARGSRDASAWASLADAWREIDLPFQEAYARWRHAEALLAGRGGRRVAAAELGAAAREASRLGAEPLRAAIGALARRAGIRLPAETATGETARTFLFTDIVGSTALLETIGDDAWTALRAWHDATLRRLFARHGGVEVDHAGDGFFVTFPSPVPAVACAVEIQRTLAAHRRAAGFAPAVRIGLHHGEAVRSGAGWAGRDVHLAARLMARAGAGEIIASATTLAAAGRPAEDAEPVRLAGLAGTVEAAAVPWR
jgi:class 3 adenylate cyclase